MFSVQSGKLVVIEQNVPYYFQFKMLKTTCALLGAKDDFVFETDEGKLFTDQNTALYNFQKDMEKVGISLEFPTEENAQKMLSELFEHEFPSNSEWGHHTTGEVYERPSSEMEPSAKRLRKIGDDMEEN